MLQESEFLPHSLSLFGAVEGPLTGLDLDFLAEASGEQTLSAALMHMMTMHSSEELTLRLSSIQDHLPSPKLPTWDNWQEEESVTTFNAEERRLFYIFRQLINEKRKSTRYYNDFKNLCHQHPETEILFHMLCSYIIEWENVEHARLSLQEHLNKHPEWLSLRLLLARSFLHEETPDYEGFQTAMEHKLLFEQHLSNIKQPVSDLLVYQFHLEMYLFFSLQCNLPRAAWCFNICCQSISDPQVMESLAPFILASVDLSQTGSEIQALIDFLSP